MDAQVAGQLIAARKSLRKKLRALKSDITSSQLKFEQQFKPLTQPINQLLSEIKQEDKTIEKEDANKQERSFTRGVPLMSTPKPPPQLHTPTILEDVFMSEPRQKEEEMVSNQELYESIQNLTKGAAFKEFLEQYPPLPRQYIEEMISDTGDMFDHRYGVRWDPVLNKFHIGNSEVDFVDDFVIVKGVKYRQTPGLFELLFKKDPIGYKESDLSAYRDILERTAAAHKNYDPDQQISGNVGIKYKKVIQNLRNPKLRPRSGSLQHVQRPRSGSLQHEGRALKTLDVDGKQDFNWKDSNALVNRLRLLIRSQQTGNTGHNIEISHIISELKKAMIIV